MIPKKLHFIYTRKSLPLPEKYEKNIKEWQRLCPDWEVHLYTDDEIKNIFNLHFPEYVEELPKIPIGAMVADVFRYAVIYLYGGMYNDIDTVPLKKIPEHWLNYDAVIGYEYQPDQFPELLSPLWKYDPIFCQWSFLSHPKNPLFKEALDSAFHRLREASFTPKKQVDVLNLTGPLLFTSVVKHHLKNSNQLILDADYFATDPAKEFAVTDRSVVQHQFDGHSGWEWNVVLPHINIG